MKLVEITKEQFDIFANTHIYASFYQTSAYGTLMTKQGFSDFYLGIVDDNHNIKCASLFIRETKKSVVGTLNYAYAPRGFLIDYSDIELLTFFTKELRRFLLKKGIAFIRLDPPLIHKEHDRKGDIKKGGIDNSNIIILMQTLGYEHLGFSNYFETLKPRWNAICKFSGTPAKLFTLFNKETRNKIRKAGKLGIEIIESDQNSINQFYKFVEHKHIRNLEYYNDLYNAFGKDSMFHIYFAKINPIVYLHNSKKSYEKEQINNMNLINKITQNKNAQNETIINKKMESDRLLAGYKDDIIKASNLAISYPNGALIGTSAVVTYQKEVHFLIDGYDQSFQGIPANHLLKWKIMETYAAKGYTIFNLNGLSGDFNKENKYYGLYAFKTGFNADVIEYVGEFDLIINAPIYQMYRNVPQLQQYLKKQ